MAQKQSLYKNVVPLNSNKHLKYKMSEMVNYSFAKLTNAALLTTEEFEKASKTYPILFVRDGENIIPVALFGLEDKQNLFLKWNNQWAANYIPAHIRRYPFSLAQADSTAEFVVCIDEKSTVLGLTGEHSLFLENGKQSDYLNEKIRFLQELQVEYEKTLLFTKKLLELDLLESMNASVNLNNGDNLTVSGFYTISKDEFKQLEAEQLKELVNTDEMKLVYEHFSSLDNFSKLIDVISERKSISKVKKTSKKKISNKIKEKQAINTQTKVSTG